MTRRHRFVSTVCGLAAVMLTCAASPASRAAGPVPPRQDVGPAPEFAGIKGWLNGGPLTMAGLRGKVVLVDFWAYSCINCIRTLPFLERWQSQYGSQGLVVVGVHTPEFRFETNPHNIQSAISRFGINYPVAEDDDMQTWNAFHNRYWPAEYLIDRAGHIVSAHAGEGEYGATENAIRTLLGNHSSVGPENGVDLSRIGSPEMYFGLQRVAMLASPQAPRAGAQIYTAPATLPLNRFALVGRWSLAGESATLAQPGGRILLHCRSGKIFMVASSTAPVTVKVTVDGKPAADVTIQGSRLYTLFDSSDYGEHELELDIPRAGLSAFTFTFG
ncbi:redoxin domain-containing protein [Lichenicola sp.]|uniref:redoxin domain-containing protein n=1 Tax=Lichenicola sp. TaxID=2804529 RepID=UPI003AFFBAFE